LSRFVSICDWLPPDFGAVGQYAAIEARRLATEGHEVTLIGLSSAGDAIEEERVGNGLLRTVRLAARPYERANLRRRAMWTAGTNWRLLRRAWRYARNADEVLFTGSPPFFLHWIVPLSRFRLLSGNDVLTTYTFGTGVAKHLFCSVCGIYTHHQRRSNPTLYSYNVGCLEGVNPFDIDDVALYDGVNHPLDQAVFGYVRKN
jgi:hypothetical protein